MTGYDLYKRVCMLLGCFDLILNGDNAKSAAFCGMVNQIAQDLDLPEIKSLSDPLQMEAKHKEAMIYGSAMLFSVALGDDGCAKMYTQLYNSKRCKALCSTDLRSDVLPAPQNGGA